LALDVGAITLCLARSSDSRYMSRSQPAARSPLSRTPLTAAAWRSAFGYVFLFVPLFHVFAGVEGGVAGRWPFAIAAVEDAALDLTVYTLGLLAFAAVPTLLLHLFVVGLVLDGVRPGRWRQGALALAPAASLLLALAGVGLLLGGPHGVYATPLLMLTFPVAFLLATFAWSAFLGYGLRAVQRAEADV
jgi:hypothetical protein